VDGRYRQIAFQRVNKPYKTKWYQLTFRRHPATNRENITGINLLVHAAGFIVRSNPT
jgi:hypothetical protein